MRNALDSTSVTMPKIKNFKACCTQVCKTEINLGTKKIESNHVTDGLKILRII